MLHVRGVVWLHLPRDLGGAPFTLVEALHELGHALRATPLEIYRGVNWAIGTGLGSRAEGAAAALAAALLVRCPFPCGDPADLESAQRILGKAANPDRLRAAAEDLWVAAADLLQGGRFSETDVEELNSFGLRFNGMQEDGEDLEFFAACAQALRLDVPQAPTVRFVSV